MVARNKDIIRFGLMATVMFIISGCAKTQDGYWYKEGTTPQEVYETNLNCRIYASQSVPVNTDIYTIYGNIYSRDTNINLRSEAESQCMRQSGFQYIDIES